MKRLAVVLLAMVIVVGRGGGCGRSSGEAEAGKARFVEGDCIMVVVLVVTLLCCVASLLLVVDACSLEYSWKDVGTSINSGGKGYPIRYHSS